MFGLEDSREVLNPTRMFLVLGFRVSFCEREMEIHNTIRHKNKQHTCS